MASTIDRRDLLKYCGMGVFSFVLPLGRVEVLKAQSEGLEIRPGNNYGRGQWFYDPIGLYIEKGQTVKFTGAKWGTTITAFHPSNFNHELRIPANAKPFDSGVLGEDSEKYSAFQWTFDVEGTYDFFSRNHEPVGMVGRIVVGTPGGPAENPPGYGAREGRAPVFPAQAKILNAAPSAEIVSKKRIPFPRDLVLRQYPYGELR
jgi:plastocyanin